PCHLAVLSLRHEHEIEHADQAQLRQVGELFEPLAVGLRAGRPLDDQVVDGAERGLLVGHSSPPCLAFAPIVRISASRGIIPTGRRGARCEGGCRVRPGPRLRSLPVSRLASVYPIVSARALARPFTYEIGDDVGKGAVLAIPFGNARRRGVVVDADAEAPPDVEPVAAERVLETLPPALVDL